MPPISLLTDAHVHLWDPDLLRYDWLASAPSIGRAHTLADYAAATGGLPVASRVFVQCECDPAQARDEVAWVAAMEGIDAIVAYAPLETGRRCADDLAWLAAQPKVRGVRRNLQGESDPDFCLRDDFIAGVRALAAHRFTFDLCINRHQLPAATRLAEGCPEVTFILDHLGKPAIKDRNPEPWRTHLAALARLPNVVAKLSGLVTEADPAAWSPADLRPYVEHAIACFGWDRVLFGGDWPVVNLAGGYARWIAALRELTATASSAQLHALFHANAARVYRLNSLDPDSL
ncbi:MAG: amidohydrolase family protein [Verrucomicrobia bacterium]|nr:amidohydrolase family protein [Verrucomicrobiota bacterium]